MIKNTNLIVGIDPGTTKGYAILDFNGDLIKINSFKDISTSDFINEIISYGRPVVVATDVTPTPKFVKKIARAIGARIIIPEKTLDVKKKKKLTSDYSRLLLKENLDKHKLDALAAAYYAFKRIRVKLDKIKIVLDGEDKTHLEDGVRFLVINRNININNALKQLD